MTKKKKPRMQYRYYDIPAGAPLLVLQGEKWIQTYGLDTEGNTIDYLHFHNHLEVGYCYDGIGTITLEDETVEFRGGMFSVIPSKYPHTTDSRAGTKSTWAYLFIDVDMFLNECYPDNSFFVEELLRGIEQKACLAKSKDYPMAAAIIRQILTLTREKREFYIDEVRAMLWALLLEIVRINKEQAMDLGICQKDRLLISKALDYVGQNYDQQLKVEELAGVCHISETHFRRLFHAIMDMTPVEYINLVRIQTACEYMKKTNDSIADIAQRTGFPTLSTFNRNFKRVMGVCPRKWRSDIDGYERRLTEYEISSKEGW